MKLFMFEPQDIHESYPVLVKAENAEDAETKYKEEYPNVQEVIFGK